MFPINLLVIRWVFFSFVLLFDIKPSWLDPQGWLEVGDKENFLTCWCSCAFWKRKHPHGSLSHTLGSMSSFHFASVYIFWSPRGLPQFCFWQWFFWYFLACLGIPILCYLSGRLYFPKLIETLSSHILFSDLAFHCQEVDSDSPSLTSGPEYGSHETNKMWQKWCRMTSKS